MTRLILASVLAAAGIGAAVWTVPAWGQEWLGAYLPKQSDVIEMRESSEGHLAEVFYSNAADSSSSGFRGLLEFGEVQARVIVRIGGEDVQYAEIIEVTPLHPQHMVWPEGPVHVLDGEEVVIQIMGALF